MSLSTPPQSFAYRADIDGLRAVAVLAVVLFHLSFAPFAGGFLGVDVFFVISGYLITSIIAPKMVAGTFSFKTFYLKRIRRLIPPALVTIIATFIASAFILDPNDLVAMAKSAIAAVFSVSNIFFFTEAGYWDAQSELKPLLHTWSLGVEEQFYLFWPILFLVCLKVLRSRDAIKPFRLFLCLGVLTVLGIVLSEWMLRMSAPAAFFLLPARLFEFSMGATVAFFGQSWLWQRYGGRLIRLGAGGIGLAALIFAIWFYKGHPPFPGVNGFLPCAATGLVLLAGASTQASPHSVPGLRILLGNPLMRWVGQISYSLYLVHWPVVALMRYEVGLTLAPLHQILAVAIMFGLTLILYYGVERRISARKGQVGTHNGKPPLSHLRVTGVVAASAIGASAVFAHSAATSGWVWRYDSLSLSPGQIELGKVKRFSNLAGSCLIENFPDGSGCDPEASRAILIFGNSHEPDGYTFLQSALKNDENIQLVRFNQTNQCNYGVDDGRLVINGRREGCQRRIDLIESADVMGHFNAVLYASNRPFETNKSASLYILKTMKAVNPDLKILAMGNYLNTIADCPRLFNEAGVTQICAEPKYVTASPRTDETGVLRSEFLDIIDLYIDRGELLCGADIPASCLTQTPDGLPFSYDRHHLSFDFAQYAGRKYADDNPDFYERIFPNAGASNAQD